MCLPAGRKQEGGVQTKIEEKQKVVRAAEPISHQFLQHINDIVHTPVLEDFIWCVMMS